MFIQQSPPKLGGEKLDIKTLINYVNLENFINN